MIICLQVKIHRTIDSLIEHKDKKQRCISPVESPECDTIWSTEDVSPDSTDQFDVISTPDYSTVISRGSHRDYADSILGMSDSPVPSTSCYMDSPYPSENSPDAESNLAMPLQPEVEITGVDLCADLTEYYESFDTFQQQQHSLQAGYSVEDSHEFVYVEPMSDEDLFSNMMPRNMVTANMNEIQPEIKPYTEEEKHSEFEDIEGDSNISGVVDGICKNLDSEIVTDTDGMQVIEQIIDDGLKDEVNSESIYAPPCKVTTENNVHFEVIQPIYTTGPSKTITTYTDNVQSHLMNQVGNDKVVVQKINNDKLPVAQENNLSFDTINENKNEQKASDLNELDKSPDVQKSITRRCQNEQEVPKKLKTYKKSMKIVTHNNGDSKPEKRVQNELELQVKTSVPEKVAQVGKTLVTKEEKTAKRESTSPVKLKKTSSASSQVLDRKNVTKSSSKAEELFDLVKNSTLDDVKKPINNKFDKSTIYIPRQAFNHASRKIQEEYRTHSRKRKPYDDHVRPVKYAKTDYYKSDSFHNSSKQKSYKLIPVDVIPSRSSSSPPGCQFPSFSYRTPSKGNTSNVHKTEKTRTKNDDTWLYNPQIMDTLERLKHIKKIPM